MEQHEILLHQRPAAQCSVVSMSARAACLSSAVCSYAPLSEPQIRCVLQAYHVETFQHPHAPISNMPQHPTSDCLSKRPCWHGMLPSCARMQPAALLARLRVPSGALTLVPVAAGRGAAAALEEVAQAADAAAAALLATREAGALAPRWLAALALAQTGLQGAQRAAAAPAAA